MTNFGRTVSLHQGYPVAPCIPPETEANPVQRLFCQLNDGLLVMFRYFSFVRCPCNSLLWQRQLNLCIYNNNNNNTSNNCSGLTSAKKSTVSCNVVGRTVQQLHIVFRQAGVFFYLSGSAALQFRQKRHVLFLWQFTRCCGMLLQSIALTEAVKSTWFSVSVLGRSLSAPTA